MRRAGRPLYPVLSVAALLVLVGLLVLRARRQRPEVPPEPLPCVMPPEGWAVDTRNPETSHPTPRTPFEGQKRAPCDVPPEVEANGGCWVELKQRPPCGRLAYENVGRCLMPVLAYKPTPVSGPAP
jgi:hypothetical protein